MRLSSGILWAIALSAVRTVATDASIYLAEPPSGVSKQALSPATSRLLFARRLGLSQFHSLEGADDATLQILNDYGGEQKALLSTDEPWTGPQRNLIIVEGVDNPEGQIPTSTLCALADFDAQISFVSKLTDLLSQYQIHQTSPIPFS